MTICEDVLASALSLKDLMRERKTSGYSVMSRRKPSENLDVMVLPATLEALATSEVNRETDFLRPPQVETSTPPRAPTRLEHALLSRASSAEKELPMTANPARQDAAGVLQERVRFQVVQRHRGRLSPRLKTRRPGSPKYRKPWLHRPAAMFATVLEKFGISWCSEVPGCAMKIPPSRLR